MKRRGAGSAVFLGTLVMVAAVAMTAAVAGESDGRSWDGGAAYEQEQAIAKTLPDERWEPLLTTVLDGAGSIVVVLYAIASDSDIAEAERKHPHRVVVSHFTPESYERAENAAMSIAVRTATSAFGVYYDADTDTVRVEGDVDPVSAERIQATVPGDITVVIDTSPGGRYSG